MISTNIFLASIILNKYSPQTYDICRVGFVRTDFLLEPKVALTKELLDETHHEESTKKVKEGFC